MHRSLAAALLVVLVTCASPSLAQDGTSGTPSWSVRRVLPGYTVRLTNGTRTAAEGAFVRSDSASVAIVRFGTLDTVSYPRTSFDRAEVLTGQRPRGAKAVGTGALVGLAVGGTLILGALSDEPMLLLLGIPGGFLAVAAGAGIGAAMATTMIDEWTPFDPTSLAISPVREVAR